MAEFRDHKHTYIALYRGLIDSPVFAHEGLLKIWIWCLLRANYTEKPVPIITGRGQSIVTVGPGQFIFGRKSAAKELSMQPGTVYDRMQKLSELDMINIQSNNHYSIVSICNWDYYQVQLKNNQQATNNQPTGNQQATNTDNKVNKVNKGNNKKNNNVPFADILDYWKQHKRLVDKCDMRAMTKQRKEKVKARWQEQDFKDNWQAIIKKSNESDFLTGPEFPGFSFDWIIKNDTNYMKVLEGKYDNKGAKTHSQSDKRIERLKKQSANYLNGGNNK